MVTPPLLDARAGASHHSARKLVRHRRHLRFGPATLADARGRINLAAPGRPADRSRTGDRGDAMLQK